MPPRKRAASAPAEEPEPETAAPETETEADGQQAEHSDDSATPTDGGGDQKPDEDGPERSDLQTVEQPCQECMPNGWPEGAYAVGCTHGTWVREQD